MKLSAEFGEALPDQWGKESIVWGPSPDMMKLQDPVLIEFAMCKNSCSHGSKVEHIQSSAI